MWTSGLRSPSHRRNIITKWQKLPGQNHIVRTLEGNTADKNKLLEETIAELKKACDIEKTYEATIEDTKKNVRAGDTVRIAADRSGIFVEARTKRATKSLIDSQTNIEFGDYVQLSVPTIENRPSSSGSTPVVESSLSYIEFGSSGTSVTLSAAAVKVANSNIEETNVYNAAADSLTLKRSGRYIVICAAQFQGTGIAHFSINMNGTSVQTTSTYVSGSGTTSTSAIVSATVGDVMTFTEWCDDGQTLSSSGLEKVSVQKLS